MDTALRNYTGENIDKVEPNVESLKQNVLKSLSGVENLNICLASLKASVAQLVAQNNRTLLGIVQRYIDSSESPNSDSS
jgi:hypothetical protein